MAERRWEDFFFLAADELCVVFAAGVPCGAVAAWADGAIPRLTRRLRVNAMAMLATLV